MVFSKCFKRAVNVGDPAPAFSLPDQTGRVVNLSDFLGKWVVLYFYPKDNTKHCIVESTEFRDQYDRFTTKNVEILGISSDSPESHAEFAGSYRLPFTLLSDHKKKVRRAYGVPNTFGVIPGRVTFVIDPTGIVRHVFSSQFNPKSHVKEALEALNRPTRG